MSFGYINSGMKKLCALLLVGTMAGSASVSQVACGQNAEENTKYINELLLGHYSDEDVKKSKDDLMKSIGVGSSAKTYEKKRDLCPKIIKK